MADNTIDMDAFRKRRPQLFRDADSMAVLRLEHHQATSAASQHQVRTAAAWAEAPTDSFFAYAPDPELDYARGIDEGRRLERLDAAARAAEGVDTGWQDDGHSWTAKEQAWRCLIYVGIPAAIFIFLIWRPFE